MHLFQNSIFTKATTCENKCDFQAETYLSLTSFTHKVNILYDLFLLVLNISSQYVLKGYWCVFSMNRLSLITSNKTLSIFVIPSINGAQIAKP